MPRRVSNEVKTAEQFLNAWLDQNQNAEIVRQAEALPLRRDIESLLTYVRDNKVVGTQANNMPMKAVREVAARFVKPPELEIIIGKNIHPHRSEEHVWPVNFIRILAEVGGLLKIGAARRWRLTRKGEKFLAERPLQQLAFLMTTWWFKTNWLVAYPFGGIGDDLPRFFEWTTLTKILALPIKTRIPFESFADELIEKTGLTWTAQDMTGATDNLHHAIERIVIRILADFDAIECEHREEPLYEITISKLVAFEITPLGKLLLEAVAINTRAVL